MCVSRGEGMHVREVCERGSVKGGGCEGGSVKGGGKGGSVKGGGGEEV